MPFLCGPYCNLEENPAHRNQLFIDQMFRLYPTSLPWPKMSLPMYTPPSQLVPTYFNGWPQFHFDARDATHPFSNHFAAPIPFTNWGFRNLFTYITALKIVCHGGELKYSKSVTYAATDDEVRAIARDYMLNGKRVDVQLCDEMDRIQLQGLLLKFLTYKDLRAMLLATGDAPIVCLSDCLWNSHESCGQIAATYDEDVAGGWGNHLGEGLMAIRSFFSNMRTVSLERILARVKAQNEEICASATANGTPVVFP